MRVLMTADAVGGVWTYALELAQALEPSGVEVVLATMGEPVSAEQRHEARLCPSVELEESHYRLEWMQNPWQDVDRAGDWLLRLEQEHRPDVVHLNGYAHGAMGFACPVLIVGHSCVRTWWTAVHGAGNAHAVPREWDTYTRRVRRGLRGADLVVAPTEAMLGDLDDHYGPLGATHVIPNGRHPRRFAPQEKEPLILAVGRLWDDAKNASMLARVADVLPWPIAMAGSITSPDGGAIYLPSRVRSLGHLAQGQLARWMARASIYALPARYEPFGLSVLEAALSGCALVLGDIPSLREIWGDAALFVSPDDDGALVHAITRLTRDRSLLQSLSRRARARALELSPQRMAVRYAAAYERLRDGRTASEASACAS